METKKSFEVYSFREGEGFGEGLDIPDDPDEEFGELTPQEKSEIRGLLLQFKGIKNCHKRQRHIFEKRNTTMTVKHPPGVSFIIELCENCCFLFLNKINNVKFVQCSGIDAIFLHGPIASVECHNSKRVDMWILDERGEKSIEVARSSDINIYTNSGVELQCTCSMDVSMIRCGKPHTRENEPLYHSGTDSSRKNGGIFEGLIEKGKKTQVYNYMYEDRPSRMTCYPNLGDPPGFDTSPSSHSVTGSSSSSSIKISRSTRRFSN